MLDNVELTGGTIRVEPLVSVVTPAYNAERFIEHTLLSVKSQDYPNIEHIVINDGSTDDTPRILRSYEDKYNLIWFSKPNEGQSVTVNKGFEMAKGEIVIWLNADDVLFDKGVVSCVVEQFKKFPDTQVIYGDNAVINEDNLVLRIQHAFPWFSYNRLLRDYFAAFIFFKASIVKKRKLDTNIDLAMDYEYCLRIATDGARFKHINKTLIAYRKHGTTKSLSRWEEVKTESRELKVRYGQDFGARYYLFKQWDYVLFTLLRIYGAITISRLFLNPEKQNLAFPAKFDSVLKAVSRQLFQLPKL